jgi:hypothetical protein
MRDRHRHLGLGLLIVGILVRVPLLRARVGDGGAGEGEESMAEVFVAWEARTHACTPNAREGHKYSSINGLSEGGCVGQKAR